MEQYLGTVDDDSDSSVGAVEGGEESDDGDIVLAALGLEDLDRDR